MGWQKRWHFEKQLMFAWAADYWEKSGTWPTPEVLMNNLPFFRQVDKLAEIVSDTFRKGPTLLDARQRARLLRVLQDRYFRGRSPTHRSSDPQLRSHYIFRSICSDICFHDISSYAEKLKKLPEKLQEFLASELVRPNDHVFAFDALCSR